MRYGDPQVRLELAKAFIIAGRSTEEIPAEVEKLEEFIGVISTMGVVPQAVTSRASEARAEMTPADRLHQP